MLCVCLVPSHAVLACCALPQGWWWLVLENCAAGDLYRIVQASGPIQQEGWLVSQVLLPILQTLAYLHAEGIIHRDIKPEHVLFNSEKVSAGEAMPGLMSTWRCST